MGDKLIHWVAFIMLIFATLYIGKKFIDMVEDATGTIILYRGEQHEGK